MPPAVSPTRTSFLSVFSGASRGRGQVRLLATYLPEPSRRLERRACSRPKPRSPQYWAVVTEAEGDTSYRADAAAAPCVESPPGDHPVTNRLDDDMPGREQAINEHPPAILSWAGLVFIARGTNQHRDPDESTEVVDRAAELYADSIKLARREMWTEGLKRVARIAGLGLTVAAGLCIILGWRGADDRGVLGSTGQLLEQGVAERLPWAIAIVPALLALVAVLTVAISTGASWRANRPSRQDESDSYLADLDDIIARLWMDEIQRLCAVAAAASFFASFWAIPQWGTTSILLAVSLLTAWLGQLIIVPMYDESHWMIMRIPELRRREQRAQRDWALLHPISSDDPSSLSEPLEAFAVFLTVYLIMPILLGLLNNPADYWGGILLILCLGVWWTMAWAVALTPRSKGWWRIALLCILILLTALGATGILRYFVSNVTDHHAMRIILASAFLFCALLTPPVLLWMGRYDRWIWRTYFENVHYWRYRAWRGRKELLDFDERVVARSSPKSTNAAATPGRGSAAPSSARGPRMRQTRRPSSVSPAIRRRRRGGDSSSSARGHRL